MQGERELIRLLSEQEVCISESVLNGDWRNVLAVLGFHLIDEGVQAPGSQFLCEGLGHSAVTYPAVVRE